MQFESITYEDLNKIRYLRPEGWNDIVPSFEFYIKSKFCYPIKIKQKDKIVGVGSSIIFDNSSWIAHIIVDKNFRRQGIGYQIVNILLENLKEKSVQTCSLIASELGKPVYEKAGFKLVTEYCFMSREEMQQADPPSANIKPFEEIHRLMIYELDKYISGENRERLLVNYLNNSMVYVKDNILLGFYIPELGEGHIIAETEEAGIELMKIKYPKADKAVLPYDNIKGINYLKQNGFAETNKKGTRMIYGKELNWQPEKIFGRIGGHLG